MMAEVVTRKKLRVCILFARTSMASVRKLKPGVWIATVRRTGYPSKSKCFRTKTEAAKWAVDHEARVLQHLTQKTDESSNLSLHELLDWFDSAQVPKYRSQATPLGITKTLRAYLPDCELRLLAPESITRYRDKRLADGRSGSTVVRELNVLTRAINLARKELGIRLPINPAQEVIRPKASPPRDRRPDTTELEALINHAYVRGNQELAWSIELAVETGMRLGELVGIRIEKIDLISRIILLNETKNGEPREVPLSRRGYELVLKLKGNRDTGELLYRWRTPEGLKSAWRRLRHSAGITGLRFHDLRHEAASRFFEKGLNQFQVAAITGHKTLQMLKRYTHLRAPDLVRLLD
jgi:integrase